MKEEAAAVYGPGSSPSPMAMGTGSGPWRGIVSSVWPWLSWTSATTPGAATPGRSARSCTRSSAGLPPTSRSPGASTVCPHSTCWTQRAGGSRGVETTTSRAMGGAATWLVSVWRTAWRVTG